MNLFDKFSAEFSKNFITNNIYSLGQIKSKLENGSMKIKTINNGFLIQECDFINYFVKENKKIDFSPSKIRLFYQNSIDEENLKFLELNNFEIYEKYFYMNIREFSGIKYDEISADNNDIDIIYAFLERYFKGLMYFSKNELLEKLKKGEIIYKKECEKIAGVLIYSKTLSYAFIDYIAVDKEIANKDLAFKLMQELGVRQKNIGLFVGENNKKAIDFYTKFGFKKGAKNMNIYIKKDAK